MKPCCNRIADGMRCLGPSGHGDDTFCCNVDLTQPRAKTMAEFDARKPAAEAYIVATRTRIFAKYTKGVSK